MRTLLLLLSIFLLISVVSCGDGVSNGAGVFVEYQNSDYGYTLRYPSSWTMDTADPSWVSFKPIKGRESFVIVSACKLDSEINIERFVSDYMSLRALKPQMEKFVLLESGRTTGFWDWYTSYSFVWKEGDVRSGIVGTDVRTDQYKGRMYTKGKDGYLYFIQAEIESRYEYKFAEVEGVVSSFELDE